MNYVLSSEQHEKNLQTLITKVNEAFALLEEHRVLSTVGALNPFRFMLSPTSAAFLTDMRDADLDGYIGHVHVFDEDVKITKTSAEICIYFRIDNMKYETMVGHRNEHLRTLVTLAFRAVGLKAERVFGFNRVGVSLVDEVEIKAEAPRLTPRYEVNIISIDTGDATVHALTDLRTDAIKTAAAIARVLDNSNTDIVVYDRKAHVGHANAWLIRTNDTVVCIGRKLRKTISSHYSRGA